MNLEKFGQNFGQKVKWLIFDQMSRVGSRDCHADGDLKVACLY